MGSVKLHGRERLGQPMKPIWQRPISAQLLNSIHVGTTVAHLGIEFLEVGDDFIRARAPVDARTRQPMGILHGGISVLLAESLGSCGAAFSSPPGVRTVGLEINANHVRSVDAGWVIGVGRPFHRGRTTHVWHIELRNDDDQLTCISRITLALLAADAS
jgi:1,4-dihydroxy-2-naphthoyl-CoA hydrolase